ncbi:hypothetical protein [Brachyspira intermedia]|uniref:hypothetical protein n=1 Tax=Brachyspira intermedia TaxID=84377 RepID=UPI003005F02C
MVVLYERYGNHSNRLIQNIHFEAYCKHHNIPFYNLDFYDMEDIYGIKTEVNYTNMNKLFTYILTKKRKITENVIWEINKVKFSLILLYIYDQKWHENNYELYDKQILKHKRSIILVKSWYFRCNDYIDMYRDYFVKKYTPINLNSEEYNSIKNIFVNYDIKVGVHIRKGDYKEWNGGQYYYEDNVYNDIIEQFVNLHKNKRILFILFSNEEITLKPNYDYVISKCKWYEDHSLMSMCDYLIGPPSTFTSWASFIGNVPMYHIKNKHKSIELSDFILNGIHDII